MSNPARPKAPLDALQSTLDGIFIEIGNSLYISDKVPPKALVANANVKLRSAIPKAIETFHQALDDIETDIVRAKAVLLRDLEEARAKRIALENPPPPQVVEEPVKTEPTADVVFPHEDIMAESDLLVPPPKLEDSTNLVQWEELASLDAPKDIDSKEPSIQKKTEDISIPGSNDVNTKAGAVDLNKNVPSAADDLITSNAALDSLLDISADNNNNDDLNINFDDMDFSQFATNEESSQTQQNDDFLSTFGNDVQDFSLPDLHTTSNTQNLNSNTENKKDDLFELANTTAGDDFMDIDFLPPEESSFDDLFAHAGEDNGSTSGNMGHTTLDADFFNMP